MNETAEAVEELVETGEVTVDSEGKEAEAPAKSTKKKKCTGVSQDAKIEILVTSNPKRPGSASYDRFEGYLTEKAPATVKDALENGLIMGDIHYDFIHGSINVEGATVVEYEPNARGPNAAKGDSDDAVTELDEELPETEGDDDDGF